MAPRERCFERQDGLGRGAEARRGSKRDAPETVREGGGRRVESTRAAVGSTRG